MRRGLASVLLLLMVGVLAHPLGGLLAVFFGRGYGQAVGDLLRPGSLFFMAVALVMLAGHAAVGFVLLTATKGAWAARMAVYVDFCVAAALALGAQTWAWTEAHKDAQGALLFLFLPLYAALAAGAVGLVALPVAAVVRWAVLPRP